MNDLRYAFRTLAKSPGFTVAAILTLGLGIGANTAIFSVLDAVLLRPLPYEKPDQIVTLWENAEGRGRGAVSEPNFDDWRARARSFETMALHSNYGFGGPTTILGAETAVRAWVAAVSQHFFQIFRVRPTRGRLFSAEEHHAGGPAVALVSHGFWRSRLAADPNVLGRTLTFGGEPYEVVGVLPDGFHYPGETDVWVPLERFGANRYRTAHNWAAVGRLGRGITPGAAQREMDRIGQELRQEVGEKSDARGAVVTRLQDELFGDLRRPLLVLLGAASLVLLVACLNLASMLLARGMARGREIAIRGSLGAGRMRLVRQFFTESVLLALLGAVAGVTLANLLLPGLLSLRPASLPPLPEVRLDGRLLGFTVAMAGAALILFGLLPAFRASAGEPSDLLRSGTRSSADGLRGGGWGLLVGGETAVALLLLVGSGLFIRSFREVLRIDPGFDAERVLTVDLSLPESKYDSDAAIASYFHRVLAQLQRIPGVEDVGVIQHLPLGGVNWSGMFEIEGEGKSSGWGNYRIVSADYFAAMRIRLHRGRFFTDADRADAPGVAIINQAMAEREWPGQDPLGKRFRDIANEPTRYRDQWLTVVGIVANVRHSSLFGGGQPEMYVHVLQHPARAREAVLALRTSVPPASLAGAVRARLQVLDPDVPAEFTTMVGRVVASVSNYRFLVLVLAAFAALAVVLAAIGIYGVTSYSVVRRTREIGIRLALGAEPRTVRRMVQKTVLSVVLIGSAAGIVAALLLTRVLRSLLYEIQPTDPLTFGGVIVVLATAASIAAYLPARRATKVDPMVALRYE